VTATTPRHMAVQSAALLIAIAFLVVGLLGFIPGVTTDYGSLEWAGPDSGAKLFGAIAVSGAHNVMHLAFAVVGLVLTRSYASARAYLIGGGLIYLAVWVYKSFADGRINFVPTGGASDWLHFGLGAAMVILGLTLAGQRDPTKRRRRKVARKDAKGP